MKVSIATAILILLVAAVFGISNQQRLTLKRENHAKLVAAASQLGISVDPSNPESPVRVSRRERESKEANTKLFAAEFIAFVKEMETMEESGGTPDEAQRQRMMEMMDRMMSLDSSQLKILITEFHAAGDIADETRMEIIGFSIMTLANDHPEAALALFIESTDLFKEDGMSERLVSSSLARWAMDDPMAAVEWVRKNSAKFPDLITDEAKQALIAGTAKQDPKLAFRLIGDLGIKEMNRSISDIVMAARTSGERTATLAALREHLATLPGGKVGNESQSAIQLFALNTAHESFAARTKWIAESNFTPEELQSYSRGLSNLDSEENGKWVEWIGENLPPDKAANDISNLVRNWTRKDYQAAGKWLNTAAEGPTKNAAVSAYAETVSEYEPATAAQWAMTLPPGQDRDLTLWKIYQNWPKDDTAAKEAFKQKHGIK